jgi:hypothetical protein
VEQNRAAFEYRKVAIGQPWHLAEGLVLEMSRFALIERCALNAISQFCLLQCHRTRRSRLYPRGILGTQSKVVRTENQSHYGALAEMSWGAAIAERDFVLSEFDLASAAIVRVAWYSAVATAPRLRSVIVPDTSGNYCRLPVEWQPDPA